MIKLGNNSIGKIYLGSNAIGKAYLGSNLVYQFGSAPGPGPGPEPPGPQYIQYIRGGADGSYIDTGITPDGTTKVIVWARNFNPAANYTWLFGSREAGATHQFGIYGCITYNTGKIGGLYASEAFYTGDAFSLMSGYHKYELNGNVFSVDDTVVATATEATITSSRPIYLFGMNSDNTLLSPTSPIDICACQIFKNGVLVRDYTAVNSSSVGLYDAISDTVFTNAGGGVFAYGEFDKNAYTPLAYIESSGLQYFNTGAYGTYAGGIVTKFMPTNTTAKWTSLLGYRTTTNCCDISFGTATSGQDNMKCYWRLGTNDTHVVAFNGSSSNKLTNKEVIAVKSNSTLTLYYNNSQIGSGSKTGVSSSFQTTYPMAVGTLRTGESAFSSEGFEGRIYYVGIGAGCSLVPANVGSGVGMYDTYNDVFYESETGTPFSVPWDQRVRTHYFQNKNIAIIGDSISTYDADGYKYDSYNMYYPYGEVNSVEYTYWKKLMNDENATLEVNLSYSGSRVSQRSGYPTLYDRIGLIGEADTVIIALGTNDSNGNISLGEYDYTSSISQLNTTTFREAYIKGVRGLLESNPDIRIVCAIFSMGNDYRNSIKEIAQHYNLKCIDCGEGYSKVQGVHPDIAGMQEIENHFLYD